MLRIYDGAGKGWGENTPMTLDPRNELSTYQSPRLTEEQALFMARIRRTRQAGMLPSLEEIDLLIEIVEILLLRN